MVSSRILHVLRLRQSGLQDPEAASDEDAFRKAAAKIEQGNIRLLVAYVCKADMLYVGTYNIDTEVGDST